MDGSESVDLREVVEVERRDYTNGAGAYAPEVLERSQTTDKDIALARIIGECPKIREVRRTIRLHGAFGTSVLVLGATGTGKGLIAEVLHSVSNRRGEFVHVNCATIHPDLADSHLFGHEPGSFTGAGSRRRIGAIERANGGTLFLDEVPELPLHLQAKLLTVLDDGRYEPVGSSRSKVSQFRLVAATSNDISVLVSRGLFRQDLYYRIQARTIRLPDLRDRGSDVVLLARAMLRSVVEDIGAAGIELTRGAEDRLRGRRWHGNVRQLAAVITEAAIQADGGPITEAFMDDIFDGTEEPVPEAPRWIPTLDQAIDQVTRETIERALAASGGNKAEAAKLLGISTSSLYRYRRELGLE